MCRVLGCSWLLTVAPFSLLAGGPIQGFIALPSHSIYAIVPGSHRSLDAIQGTFIVPAYLTLPG